MKFKNIVNIDNLKYEELSRGTNYTDKVALISRALGTKKLGFHIEILSPNKYSCPYHYHESEEELFFILEGEATLRQNNNYQRVSKGNLIFFGLGEEYTHQLYNHTDKDFKFIAISNLDKLDITVYPDSNKINVRNNRRIFQLKNAVPYLTDEEDPSIYWDKSQLIDK